MKKRPGMARFKKIMSLFSGETFSREMQSYFYSFSEVSAVGVKLKLKWPSHSFYATLNGAVTSYRFNNGPPHLSICHQMAVHKRKIS